MSTIYYSWDLLVWWFYIPPESPTLIHFESKLKGPRCTQCISLVGIELAETVWTARLYTCSGEALNREVTSLRLSGWTIWENHCREALKVDNSQAHFDGFGRHQIFWRSCAGNTFCKERIYWKNHRTSVKRAILCYTAEETSWSVDDPWARSAWSDAYFSQKYFGGFGEEFVKVKSLCVVMSAVHVSGKTLLAYINGIDFLFHI